MENKKKGLIFLVAFIVALMLYCFVLPILSNLIQPPKFSGESMPVANPTPTPVSEEPAPIANVVPTPASEEPPSYSSGYIIFIRFSSLLTMIVAIITVISLFLTNYYYSLASGKRIWILTSSILIVLLVYVYFKIFNMPDSDITELNLLAIMNMVIVALLLISGLVVLLARKIERVKYSFAASFILFILWFLLMVAASIIEKHSLSIRAPGIGIGALGVIISLIIFIPINIYLNKKQIEEKKKKRVLLLYIPLAIVILLALTWVILYLLLNR